MKASKWKKLNFFMPFGRNIQMAISLSTYKIDTFCIKRRLSYFSYFSYNGTIKKILREHKGSFPAWVMCGKGIWGDEPDRCRDLWNQIYRSDGKNRRVLVVWQRIWALVYGEWRWRSHRTLAVAFRGGVRVKKLRIVLVDDEIMIREFLEQE